MPCFRGFAHVRLRQSGQPDTDTADFLFRKLFRDGSKAQKIYLDPHRFMMVVARSA